MSDWQETDDIVLSLQNLRVRYPAEKETVHAVNGISLRLKRGQTLGLAGETGAGKTTTALALMRMIPFPGIISCDEMRVGGTDILSLSRRKMEKFRGSEIGMIFQDPMSALNPVFSVGSQIADAVMLHSPATHSEAWHKAEEMLDIVGIPPARAVEYPHQFSGGMKQRVAIAIALACDPKLLIADEPTTSLDVTIQAQILEVLETLRKERGMSMLLISHDLGVIARTCDQAAIMYGGRVLEIGPAREVFGRTGHPYTEGLFRALPTIGSRKNALQPVPGHLPDPTHLREGCLFALRCRYALPACHVREPVLRAIDPGHLAACARYEEHGFSIDRRRGGENDREILLPGEPGGTARPSRSREEKPLLEVRRLKKTYQTAAGELHAVEDVSFSVPAGSTLGIVGESGCGKTTLGRCLLRLTEPTAGEILYEGRDILKLKKRQWRQLKREMQMVFQNPFSSLDPRWTVSQTLMEVLHIHRTGKEGPPAHDRVMKLLETVGLEDRLADAYPHELDGGRCQRVGIAMALAAEPRLIVCDEPVSALDVSVQAQILNLLRDLQQQFSLTCLLISHNLAVIRHMADDILVMYLGQVIEKAPNDELFLHPVHPYTRALLSAVPDPETFGSRPSMLLKGEVSASIDPVEECRFASRCPFRMERCTEETPPLRLVGPGHYAACFLGEALLPVKGDPA